MKSLKSRVKVGHQSLGTSDLPCRRRKIHSPVDNVSFHLLCKDEETVPS